MLTADDPEMKDTFGAIQHSQYPQLVPKFPPIDEIQDLSYVKAVLQKAGPRTASADLATFAKDATVKSVVSKRSWDIQFDSGKATFTWLVR